MRLLSIILLLLPTAFICINAVNSTNEETFSDTEIEPTDIEADRLSSSLLSSERLSTISLTTTVETDNSEQDTLQLQTVPYVCNLLRSSAVVVLTSGLIGLLLIQEGIVVILLFLMTYFVTII